MRVKALPYCDMAIVKLTTEAVEQFKALPRLIRERVQKILHRLEQWPDVSGHKALSGNPAGSYRLRTGDYRVRFRVEGELVIVEKIGHRKDVYEE
jgi:mRNA interferase RelE/StbE